MWYKRLLCVVGLLALAACATPTDPVSEQYVPVIGTQEDGATSERITTITKPDRPGEDPNL